MSLKNLMKKMAISAAIFGSASLVATACIPIGDGTGNGNTNLSDLLVDLAGVTPSTSNDGTVSFSMLADDGSNNPLFTNLQTEGMDVEVKNDDGSFSDCDHVGSDIEESSDYNTLGLLIDDSGSMEREYPQAEYGDLCLTCPHDPDRLRGEATRALIQTVLAEAPESRIQIADFGPFVDEGKTATRVMEPFSTNADQLVSALDQVDGSLEAGTPLWDSLAEMITSTDDEAEDFQGVLQVEDRRDADGTPAEVKRFVVVLSDGDDRDSTNFDLEKVVALAQMEGVVVHAIGLGPAAAQNNDPRLQVEEQIATVKNLVQLAEQTGGFYTSVNDPEGLEELYGIVAKSLTRGYQVETYKCEPKPSAAAPEEEKREPESGEKVEGRVNMNGETQSWSYIAP